MIYLVLIAALAGFFFMLTQPLLLPLRRSQAQVEVSAERLKAHVQALSLAMSPRDYLHPDNLDQVAAYVRHKFEMARGSVSEQPYETGGRRYRNVIARFGPDTAERIVVGAHYDACMPYPGADDNASGVAGLIELAHLFGHTPPPMQVELVAYTLEEPPYFRSRQMGSAVHARGLKEQGIQVRAMLSLEMIGYFSDAPDSQTFPTTGLRLFYPSQGNFIAVVGNLGQTKLTRKIKRAMREAGALPVYSINSPGWLPGVDFSDHLNYWQAGYPAVMITDTSFYRNKNYHTPQDTPDTLDYQRMAMVVKAVYAGVVKVALAD